jgi:hypothetical protein
MRSASFNSRHGVVDTSLEQAEDVRESSERQRFLPFVAGRSSLAETIDPRQQIQQRRLPAPRRAVDREQRLARHGEADLVEDPQLAPPGSNDPTQPLRNKKIAPP